MEASDKRRKILEDDRATSRKFTDEVAESVGKVKNALAEADEKRLAALTKLDAEYTALLQKRETQNADSELEEIKILNGRIVRANFEVEQKRRAGTLTIEEEKRVRNATLENLITIDALQEKFNVREATRQQKALEHRRKVEKESLQIVIQALNGFESQSIRSLGVILAGYSQVVDAKSNLSEAKLTGDSGKIQDAELKLKLSKQAAYFQTVGALSQAFFQAEQERFNRLAQQNEQNHQRESKALSEKNALELASFRGTETEKANLERRQKAESARLDAEFQKKQAALKLKAFKAEQAAKISQTLMAGALAFVEALPNYFLAAAVGGATLLQIGLISRQKPPQFADGTEFVNRQNFPRGTDTVPALLTEGERVLTVEQNAQLRGIKNRELVSYARVGMQLARLPAHQFLLENLPPRSCHQHEGNGAASETHRAQSWHRPAGTRSQCQKGDVQPRSRRTPPATFWKLNILARSILRYRASPQIWSSTVKNP